jgi:hypothetical protein
MHLSVSLRSFAAPWTCCAAFTAVCLTASTSISMGDAVADQGTAGLEYLVPRETEVLAVDRSLAVNPARSLPHDRIRAAQR